MYRKMSITTSVMLPIHLLICHLLLSIMLMASPVSHAAQQGFPPTGPQGTMPHTPFMPPMSEAEFEELVRQFEEEFKKLPPEEQARIEQEARELLIQQGINPDTLQPLEPGTPVSPLQPQQPHIEQPPQPASPAIPVDCAQVESHSREQVSCLLNGLTAHITQLRQKLVRVPFDTLQLMTYLDALAFYIAVINKPEHLQRLSSETFDMLFNILEELHQYLLTQEPALIPLETTETTEYNDPYVILQISHIASQQDIERQYAALIADTNPDVLEKNLRAQGGMSEEKIKRRVHATKSHQDALTDAYEKLNDPNLRKQIDRNRTTVIEQRKAMESAVIERVRSIESTIAMLVQRGLFAELDQFLSRYEPTQLAYRKQMEAAEQKRLEEKKALENIPFIRSLTGGGVSGGYTGGGNGYHPDYGSGYSGGYGREYAGPSRFGEHDRGMSGREASSGSSPQIRTGGGKQVLSPQKPTEKSSDKKPQEDRDRKKSDAQKKQVAEGQKLYQGFIKSLKEFNGKLEMLQTRLATEDTAPKIIEAVKAFATFSQPQDFNNWYVQSLAEYDNKPTLPLQMITHVTLPEYDLLQTTGALRKAAEGVKKHHGARKEALAAWQAQQKQFALAYQMINGTAMVLHSQLIALTEKSPLPLTKEALALRDISDNLEAIEKALDPSKDIKQQKPAKQHPLINPV